MHVLRAPNSFQILSPAGPLLQPCTASNPIPGAGEVLIEVAAAGVNRADILQTHGHYAPPAGSSDIPGLEVAGVVRECGSHVRHIRQGDRVMALVIAGGYGEFVVVDAASVMVIPENVSMVDAAAFVEAACTIWSNLIDVAHFTSGETVLIHGGSGGVGSLALQITSALGATVLTTARTPERAARCTDLGAHTAWAYGEHVDAHGKSTFADALPTLVAQATNQRGCDIILDVTGASLLGANVHSLATGGRLIVIGMQKGATGTLPLGPLLAKRASIHGTTLRSRPREERARIVKGVTTDLLPLLAAGRIRPVVHEVWDMQEAARAHEQLLGGDVFGKLVLEPRW